jgi:uncharacterized membrane protein
MNWRNNVSASDRFFACLPYLLPITGVFRYGGSLINTFPIFQSIYYGFILPVYSLLPSGEFGTFGVFLLLYFLVVRNQRVNRFVRFNTLQSIMLGVLVSLFGLALQYVVIPLLSGNNPIVVLLPMLAFLGVWAVCLFSIVKSAMGEYAEIPQLSENVHFNLDRM